jgi:hypothetical protein
MLQQSSSLKTIKKKLVRKALDMIRRIAEDDSAESDEPEGMNSMTESNLHPLECYYFYPIQGR